MSKKTQEIKMSVNIHALWLPPSLTSEDSEVKNIASLLHAGKIDELKSHPLVRGYKSKHNLITTTGRNVLARLLTGDTTYSGQINYGALGTQVSPSPANGDTQLGTEVFRKLVSSHSASNNVAFVDFFYTASDTNGTYTEFGNFIDGTGSANTGRLFSRLATGGWVKSAFESLFVSCQYTIN